MRKKGSVYVSRVFHERKIPIWFEEALQGLTATDFIKAIIFWREAGGQDRHLMRGCAWCAALEHGKCLACRKMEAEGWKARVRKNGRVPVPPIENLSERLERVEKALFIDGVARVEEGPFAPPEIIDMIESGLRDEIMAGAQPEKPEETGGR